MTNYSIQMYSIRDLGKEDLKAALTAVAKMGYTGVEFAGFYDNDPKEVRAWLDELGLTVTGTHTGIGLITPEAIEETIRVHKIIGCNDLIVPSAPRGTEQELETSIATMQYAQKVLAEQGITLGYHNHSSEFLITPYGKIVEDEIANRTDVHLEIDTFWLFNAGIDPVPYLEAHKDRIHVIHVKDGIVNRSQPCTFALGNNGAIGKSLGLGDAPVKAVREWALKNGVQMVVESEGLEPTGPEEVNRCIEYLRSLEQ